MKSSTLPEGVQSATSPQTEVQQRFHFPGFTVERVRKAHHNNERSQRHHDSYEIQFLEKGNRYYFIGDRTYHITAGDIMLIDRNSIHRKIAAGSPEYQRILAIIDPSFLADHGSYVDVDVFSVFQNSSPVIRLPKRHQMKAKSFFNAIFEEADRSEEGYLSWIKSSLIQK